MTKIEAQILDEIKLLIFNLTKDVSILSTILSYKDTLDDKKILKMLREINKDSQSH